MKQIIALTFSMLLLLSFVACGNNSDSASSTAVSSVIETSSEATSSESISSEEASSDYVSAESSDINDSSEETNDVTSSEDTSSEETSSEDISNDFSEESSEETSNETAEETSEEISEETSEECKHTDTKVTGKKTATCTAEGYTGDTVCKDCGKTIKSGSTIGKIAHDIIIKNNKTATCAAKGYTGDEFCLNCQEVVTYGEPTEKSKTHGRTELVGYVEATATANGYSGDKVCSVCGETIERGCIIPMVQNGSTFIDEFGNSVFVPTGEDVFDYTLNNAKDEIPDVDHPYCVFDDYYTNPFGKECHDHYEWDTLTVEKETFRLMNEERIKAGVAPLEWCEDAYYFAYTRAREQEKSWGHTRPNGKDFNHIFSEYDVFPGHCGENLYKVTVVPTNSATYAVNSWVKSSGHYANMINEKYTRTVIAVYFSETTSYSYFVQLFFA